MTLPWFGVELARQRLTPRDFHKATITSHMYGPEEAAQAGFLDRVVAPGELLATAQQTAEDLSKLNMKAHAETKLRVRDDAIKALRGAIERELSVEKVKAIMAQAMGSNS